VDMNSSGPVTSSFVQERYEAPTPTISNRASAKRLPPSLSLDDDDDESPSMQSSSNMSPLQAKFSSPTVPPIEMKRLPQETATPIAGSVDRVIMSPRKRGATKRPLSVSMTDYLSLSLNLDDTVWQRDYGSSSLWMFFLVHAISFASDILKTNLHGKLVPKLFQALWQHIRMSGTTISPSLENISFSAATTPPPTRISPTLFSNKPGIRQGKVQGIPNFGQTCYMNAVLQSLASLEPILVYLDRVVRIHHDQEALTQQPKGTLDNMPFAQDLLELLLMVNGIQANGVVNQHHHFNVDPRRLLKRIGETHKVFEQIGEQQDAQEYLQALVGVLISETQLDSVSAAALYTQSADLVPREEPLTAAVAGAEATHSLSMPGNQVGSCDDDHRPEVASPMSLSGLLQRMDEDQNSMRGSRINVEPGSHRLDSLTGGTEEKKQEDFEVTIPVVESVVSMESPNKKSSSGHGLTDSSLCETSWDDMSMALKIVQSSISPCTPSPLHGWLGSTIQCCKCQHIRPIQNSLFLDIPLVPSSVPAFLGTTQTTMPAPNHPSLAPCSIEQCLADFTSVERVQDVECRNCTLEAAILDLQEEETLLCCALESTERRVKAKGGDLSSETMCLKDDLRKTRLLLHKLQSTDPDAEDEDIDGKTKDDEGFAGNETLASLSCLLRTTARKCLFFTRCPAILCCHIQRRYYDPYKDRMEKSTQKVLFDEYLNLAPFCTYSAEASSSWVAGTYRPENTIHKRREPILYQLVSIIEHRGSAFGGHYMCYRRFGSSWFRVSDSNVSPVPWTYVRSCEAYMLFYEAL